VQPKWHAGVVLVCGQVILLTWGIHSGKAVKKIKLRPLSLVTPQLQWAVRAALWAGSLVGTLRDLVRPCQLFFAGVPADYSLDAMAENQGNPLQIKGRSHIVSRVSSLQRFYPC